MARPPRIPKYRRHSSGQARVTINGKDHLLGPYGSAASKEAYRRIIAEWTANPTGLVGKAEAETAPLSVNELILGYWKFAQKHYGFEGNPQRGDRYCLRDALGLIRSLYGRSPAREFGPLALKACRQKMVEMDWSRSYANAQIDRIRRMFRWGVAEELVPGSVYQALRAVASLRPGKSDARETKKVKPVCQKQVQVTLPFMPRVVQAMVQFQELTCCRPAEVCRVRPRDIDRTDPTCWIYRPGSDEGPHGAHKTAHLGHDRLIFVGPRAQAILCPFLGTGEDDYCFRPADAVAARNAKQRQLRMTPLYPSHIKRLTAQRKVSPKRGPRDHYDAHTYRQAIERACDRAFPPPEPLARREGESAKDWQGRLTTEQREELRRWRKSQRWHPNQLRHSRATELRCHGLDMTKTILGHAKIETTQIYAERDIRAAMELMRRIG